MLSDLIIVFLLEAVGLELEYGFISKLPLKSRNKNSARISGDRLQSDAGKALYYYYVFTALFPV